MRIFDCSLLRAFLFSDMGFVLIKTFNNYIEANIALSMLEEQDINCHIEDENTVTIINMSSGMRLMVHESQIERAMDILQNAEKEYLNSLECPHCHAMAGFTIKFVEESHEDALKKMPFGRFILLFSKLLHKEGTVSKVKHYVCNNCHREFNELPSQG
jgi:DNA-directed RNA polymerase subunit RPC12/RpoP